MIKINKIAAAFAMTSMLASAPVMAASDGTLGATSSGSTDISVQIVDMVKVTGLDNIALGSYTGTGDLTGTTDYCVYRNGGGAYQVTLTSTTGALSVSDGGTNNIGFSVLIDDDNDATAGGESLGYNSASLVSMAGASAADCGGSDNAQMHFTFAEADLQAAKSATYNATLTVLVEPI